ncbi:MAG: hypothetical protein Kow00133_04370 [Amphiplicatus sp.]
MPFQPKIRSATLERRNAPTDKDPPSINGQRPLEFAPMLDAILLEAALYACARPSQKTDE